MKLEAWPWARANLKPEDRVEIAHAEPRSALCSIGRDGAAGKFDARIRNAVPFIVQHGLGDTPIDAFRDALAKVPA